jgi:hypothetical protein
MEFDDLGNPIVPGHPDYEGGDAVVPGTVATLAALRGQQPVGSVAGGATPDEGFLRDFISARESLVAARDAYRRGEPSPQGALLAGTEPSKIERILAIGNAFGAPVRQPGFGGVMQNVGQTLLAQEQAKRASLAESNRLIDTYASNAATQSGLDRRARMTAEAAMERARLQLGKPSNIQVLTNGRGEQVQMASYPNGTIIETVLSPERAGEQRIIAPGGGAPSAGASPAGATSTAPATRAPATYPGADGKEHAVGDVFVAPDGKTYRMMSGGKTDEVSGQSLERRGEEARVSAEAAADVAGARSADVDFGKQYSSWVGGGRTLVDNQIKAIADVKARLEAGENLTGFESGSVLPGGIRAYTNPQAIAAQQQVEKAVQSTLRETLGAQYTQQEGVDLLARSYDPRLPPEINIEKLDRLIAELRADANTIEDKVKFWESSGSTLSNYRGSGSPSAPSGNRPPLSSFRK